jgi:hypothetical protein
MNFKLDSVLREFTTALEMWDSTKLPCAKCGKYYERRYLHFHYWTDLGWLKRPHGGRVCYNCDPAGAFLRKLK